MQIFLTIFSCAIDLHQESTFLKSESNVHKSTKTIALKKVIEALPKLTCQNGKFPRWESKINISNSKYLLTVAPEGTF